MEDPKPFTGGQPLDSDAARNASWGTMIVIVVILTMIVTAALYSWGERVAEEKALQAEYESQRY